MKHLYYLLVDIICGTQDAYNRVISFFSKKQEPSLIVENILWCTNSTWMDRLVAYKQLNLWTFDR
jgi:hypothetical protein